MQEVRDIHVLAIDLGASSGRGVVGSYGEGGGLRLEEVHRFENGALPGSSPLCWDAKALVREIREAVRKAATRFDLGSFGIDTWGVDYGLIAADGRLLTDPVHYRDARTAGLAEELAASGELGNLYAKTGIQVMDINTLFQLLAERRDRPELLGEARRLLLMPDLLGYLLCGQGGCDPSIASTTQLLDAQTGDWSAEVCERLGIPLSLLPAVAPEGEARGSLELADGARVPLVSVCGHDTAAAVASVPLDDETLFVSCGTWSLVGTVLDEPVTSEVAQRLNITNERGAEGTVLHLENCTGLWIAQELRREVAPGLSWGEIVEAAEAAAPFATLIDTEAPRFAAPGEMAAKICAFARETGQPEPADTGALFRCVFEGLALRYRDALADVEGTTGRSFSRVRVIGGGAQNGFVCQQVADVLGLPVVAGPFEATAIGNILVQLKALGAFASLAEAREAVQPSLEFVDYEPQAPVAPEVLEAYRRVRGAVR